MRVGILGSEGDQHCQALKHTLHERGAPTVILDAETLDGSGGWTFDGAGFRCADQDLDDVGVWYLRHILSHLPPVYATPTDYRLFADWFITYMQKRERHAFMLSWLLGLQAAGVPVVNRVTWGGLSQLKPLQLQVARKVGLTIPQSCVTNDPEAVRNFVAAVPGEVVYKPGIGGGLCRSLDEAALARLDRIRQAPVIFQERIRGRHIRATFVGGEPVSVVAIGSQALDYRDDPVYTSGQAQYEAAELPEAVLTPTRAFLRQVQLTFTGVDFIQQGDGTFVFLEANSSPIYLDIEQKTGVPITARLAEWLLLLANGDETLPQPPTPGQRSFCEYALPFAPEEMVGGDA